MLFSALQFAQLSAIGLLAGLPFLVLAYRNRVPGKMQTVSSVIILRTLPKQNVARSRIRLPLRFFLELAALLFLVLALARPMISDSAPQIAILIDNTLSMQAKERAQADSSTRFELAKKEARSWIETETARARFTLYTSSPKLESHGAKHSSGSAVISELDALKPFPAHDHLAHLIRELAQSGEYDTVVVFSDKAVSELGGQSKGEGETRVVGIQVGAPVGNIFLTEARLELGPSNTEQVVTQVQSSSTKTLPVEIQLFGNFVRPGTAQEADILLASRKLELRPGESEQAAFSLTRNMTRLNVFRVQMVLARAEENSIVQDDSAWIVRGEFGSLAALLVSPEEGTSLLGLEAVPGLRFSRITPEAFSKQSESELAKYRVIVFHKSAPRLAPEVSHLLILPPDKNQIFAGMQTVSAPSVTSWIDEHPITTYLRLPLLAPRSAVILDTPPWARAVVNSEAGALVVAGERNGVRAVGIGFEVLPFEGKKTPLLSVLMLNTIGWLYGTELSDGLLTGAARKLDQNYLWSIYSGEEAGWARQVEGSYVFRAPGVYQLLGEEKGGGASGRQQSLVAVNAFFENESQTLEQGVIEIAQVQKKALAPPDDSATDLSRALLLLALCILLGELLLHLRQLKTGAAA